VALGSEKVVSKKVGSIGHNRQLRTEVDDVGELQNGHLLELIAIFLGIGAQTADQILVGADDAQGLKDKEGQNQQQGNGIARSSRKLTF
jgi:hypothetical protein